MNSQLLISAFHFAAEKHKFQTRKNKDKTPYINHPIECADLLANDSVFNRFGSFESFDSSGLTNTEILIATLLHDTIEDTNTTADEIKSLFGEDVMNLVLSVSDDKSLSKSDRKRLQVQHVKNSSIATQWIKLADKVSNLSSTVYDPPEWTDDIKKGYAAWSRLIFEQMDNSIKSSHLFQTGLELTSKLGVDPNISIQELTCMVDKYYETIDNQEKMKRKVEPRLLTLQEILELKTEKIKQNEINKKLDIIEINKKFISLCNYELQLNLIDGFIKFKLNSQTMSGKILDFKLEYLELPSEYIFYFERVSDYCLYDVLLIWDPELISSVNSEIDSFKSWTTNTILSFKLNSKLNDSFKKYISKECDKYIESNKLNIKSKTYLNSFPNNPTKGWEKSLSYLLEFDINKKNEY